MIVAATSALCPVFRFLPAGMVPMINEQLAALYGGCVLPDTKARSARNR